METVQTKKKATKFQSWMHDLFMHVPSGSVLQPADWEALARGLKTQLSGKFI